MPLNFFWFTDAKIAGMGCPGNYRPLEQDLEFLKNAGIEIIVSLTASPLPRVVVEHYGFEVFNIPVEDGSAPSIPQIESFVNYINYAISDRKKVVVHCGAGYGRTGTMLACYLVSLGCAAGKAIRDVRKKIPLAIENRAQEARIVDYEHYLKEKKAVGGSK